jgi:CHASE1-domain containing sensor protein
MAKARAIVSAAFSVVSLLSSLLLLWLSLHWNVRKARRAFEKELIKEGMAREEARRLSGFYKVLKDQIVSTATSSLRDARSSTPFLLTVRDHHSNH